MTTLVNPLSAMSLFWPFLKECRNFDFVTQQFLRNGPQLSEVTTVSSRVYTSLALKELMLVNYYKFCTGGLPSDECIIFKKLIASNI